MRNGMCVAQPSGEERLKRYKSYPVSHFSRWRFYFQRWTLYLLILPYIIYKYKPKAFGHEHVPKSGPFIVAANHISMLDPLLVSHAVDYPVAYMAKKELFNTWLKAEFYRLQGCFALDRDHPDGMTLKTAFNVLKSPAKWALGLFPEGTRSTNGEVLPLKKGIGAMAKKTGTPILPVGVSKDTHGQFYIRIGPLITDVSDADRLQETVYAALVDLVKIQERG
jgi:1-acyl-sn-glycerol-3-phosphate acyltransferase